MARHAVLDEGTIIHGAAGQMRRGFRAKDAWTLAHDGRGNGDWRRRRPGDERNGSLTENKNNEDAKGAY